MSAFSCVLNVKIIYLPKAARYSNVVAGKRVMVPSNRAKKLAHLRKNRLALETVVSGIL